MMEQAGGDDTRVEVAKITQAGALERENIKGQFAGAMKLSDNQQKQVMSELDGRLKIMLAAATDELGKLKMQGVSSDSLNKIKADLAKKAMEIRATFDLANIEASADRLPKPPIEPPGRAPVGKSFTQ
jgi:hypothetical protein